MKRPGIVALAGVRRYRGDYFGYLCFDSASVDLLTILTVFHQFKINFNNFSIFKKFLLFTWHVDFS